MYSDLLCLGHLVCSEEHHKPDSGVRVVLLVVPVGGGGREGRERERGEREGGRGGERERRREGGREQGRKEGGREGGGKEGGRRVIFSLLPSATCLFACLFLSICLPS